MSEKFSNTGHQLSNGESLNRLGTVSIDWLTCRLKVIEPLIQGVHRNGNSVH